MGVAVILLAGGRSTRLGGPTNKVHRPVDGRPLLAYPLETMLLSDVVDHVVLVVRPGEEAMAADLVEGLGLGPVMATVAGGASRCESEMAGLDAVRPLVAAGSVDLIAIHDGARPFVTIAMVERLVDAARTHGGAVPALAVERPAVTIASGSPSLVPPGTLASMQTPQVFAADLLLAAYGALDLARAAAAVDTAQIVEWHGGPHPVVVAGDQRNFKVTYPVDLDLCDELVVGWQRGTWAR